MDENLKEILNDFGNKYEGEYNGMKVYSNPACPPGMVYMINENNFYRIEHAVQTGLVVEYRIVELFKQIYAYVRNKLHSVTRFLNEKTSRWSSNDNDG